MAFPPARSTIARGACGLDLRSQRLIECVRLFLRGEPPRALPALLAPSHPPPLLARIEVDTHDTPPRATRGPHICGPDVKRRCHEKVAPCHRRRPERRKPRERGLSRVRRRGLEPPPGYPGPGPSTLSPGCQIRPMRPQRPGLDVQVSSWERAPAAAISASRRVRRRSRGFPILPSRAWTTMCCVDSEVSRSII